MTDLAILDKSYNFILRHFMETGYAPHYVNLAAELGVSPEEGRLVLHDLMDLEIPGTWLHPGTDDIASFAPFSNFSTHYRITVESEQKWFGQGAFESLAVCWLFPEKEIRIDCSCLDCGEEIFVEVRDGELLNYEPNGIIGIANSGFSGPYQEWGFRGSGMNFFRSEEHMRNWVQFDPESKIHVVMSLADWMARFSKEKFQIRTNSNYVSLRVEQTQGTCVVDLNN